MKIFVRHNWLNFCLVLFGFTFFYSLGALLNERFYARAITAAIALPAPFHWVVNGTVAFLLSLTFVIFFCKPRAPLFIAAAVLLGGAFSLRPLLCAGLIHLDENLRQHGLVALYSLTPHLFLLILTAAAWYAAWLSNRAAGNQTVRKC